MTQPIPISGVVLSKLQALGLYSRPVEWRDGPRNNKVMYDPISQAPMSTEHAISRFLVPLLAKTGWAMFVDGDVLVRANLVRVFDGLDASKAAYCVKHPVNAAHAVGVKMNSQFQNPYARKWWSSMVIFNCDHEANQALTIEAINTLPGRDLHRLFWLRDDDIGELGPEYNYLVGITPRTEVAPRIVHFTQGLPSMGGFHDVEYATEWRDELAAWAA